MRQETPKSGFVIVSLFIPFITFLFFRAYERHIQRVAATVTADLMDMRFPSKGV